jgi:hypothetical protein
MQTDRRSSHRQTGSSSPHAHVITTPSVNAPSGLHLVCLEGSSGLFFLSGPQVLATGFQHSSAHVTLAALEAWQHLIRVASSAGMLARETRATLLMNAISHVAAAGKPTSVREVLAAWLLGSASSLQGVAGWR